MPDNNIPVVFATKDDNYINYMLVTICSMLNNRNAGTFYDFYVMVAGDFSQESKNKIINYLAVEKDCNVTFIDMKDCFKDLVMTHDFISYPTYFRLLVCDLLPDYDKCIYLDIDTIVLEDLSLFYAQDIEDFYLAGVRAAGYQFNAVHNIRRLGLPDVSDYINAGVLLMNLKKLRQDTMSKKFLDLIKAKYHDQDQDILNVACYGKIKILPFKYNLMTKYEKMFDQCIGAKVYAQSEIDEAIENPVIVHYADKIKPWQNLSVYFGEHWWMFARKLPFYEQMFFDNILAQQREVVQTVQIIREKPVLDLELLKNLILYSKKGFRYYRYKLLSKITLGKKKKRYKQKYQNLKQKIKQVKLFLGDAKPNPLGKSRRKKKISDRIMKCMEKHGFTKDILDLVLLVAFLLKRKKQEVLTQVDKIKFITCRYPVRQSGGGQGAALTMNEVVLDKVFKGIPVEFIYERDNKFSSKKSLGPYFDYAGFVFARKMTKDDKNTVYVTHEEETGFGLWLMGKRYVLFSHVQGSRLEEKINNGEKLSWISKQIIKFVERMAFKHAFCVCFPSKGAYDCYLKSPYKSTQKSDFKLGPVIYNTLYLNHKPEKFQNLDLDKNSLTLLSIGGLSVAKGIDQAVEVVSCILGQTRRKIRYIVVGRGVLQSKIDSRLQELKLRYANFSYCLINRCSVGEMPYLQEISDVYLMLHRISIFDLATLEMMNKSKAIVLSSVGGNLEFDKENNIIFWTGDNEKTARDILKADVQAVGALNKIVYDKYFSHEAYRTSYAKLLDMLIQTGKKTGNFVKKRM